MELTVYIPTRGRAGRSKQVTLRELKQFSSVEPILVCPEKEVVFHKYYATALGCPHDGIGPTRRWILENCPTPGCVMLDDDMYFSRREPPETPLPLMRVRPMDLDVMFCWIKDQLDSGFIHGGISARQGNQNIPIPWTDCNRVNNAHFFNTEAFRKEELHFDRTEVMEDFYITLSLLLRGYPNRVSYHFCWSQRGSGKQGGCSSYRTPEVQARAAEQLAELFPDFVKVVDKKAISGGSVFAGKIRKDVNIAWSKAWDARTAASGIVSSALAESREIIRTKRYGGWQKSPIIEEAALRLSKELLYGEPQCPVCGAPNDRTCPQHGE